MDGKNGGKQAEREIKMGETERSVIDPMVK